MTGLLLACGTLTQQAQAQTIINFAVTQPAALQVNAGTSRLFCPGEIITLQGSPTGGTGPFTYAWSPGVSNPTSAQTTVAPTATTTYNLAITDASGCTASSTVTYTLTTCTGITESHLSKFELYPNPGKDQFYLKYQGSKAMAYQLRLTNVLGQEIMVRQIPVTNELNEKLSLQGLAKGVYLLHLQNQEAAAIRKLIVE